MNFQKIWKKNSKQSTSLMWNANTMKPYAMQICLVFFCCYCLRRVLYFFVCVNCVVLVQGIVLLGGILIEFSMVFFVAKKVIINFFLERENVVFVFKALMERHPWFFFQIIKIHAFYLLNFNQLSLMNTKLLFTLNGKRGIKRESYWRVKVIFNEYRIFILSIFSAFMLNSDIKARDCHHSMKSITGTFLCCLFYILSTLQSKFFKKKLFIQTDFFVWKWPILWGKFKVYNWLIFNLFDSFVGMKGWWVLRFWNGLF